MKYPSDILGDPVPRYEPDVILKTDEQIKSHIIPLTKAVLAKLGRPSDDIIVAVYDFLFALYKLEAFTNRTKLSRADDAIVAFLCDIPQLSSLKGSSGTTVPIISLIPEITITKAMACADNSFRVAHRILYKNISRISHSEEVKRFVWPPDSDLNPIQKVREYLSGTPFERLLLLPVPFSVPIERRLEHTLVCAGTGWGKSQLLQSIILNDLQQPDPPSLIVLDSTGQMVKRIQKLALFNDKLADRLVIIDPEQIPGPALNMFDIATERLKNYTGLDHERIEGEIIELFNYVFAAAAREMTGRQSNAFSYIARLILSMEKPNIHTLRHVLADPAKDYDSSTLKPYIEKLDELTVQFFKTYFYEKGFKGTRAQVLERLLGLLRLPAFNRMFSTENKVDFFTEMQKGSIILCNTSVSLLQEPGSALFGRYLIARAMGAAYERASIPEEERRPAFLIIDEANPYTDENVETMLTKLRQFKLGVLLAYQHLQHKEITDTTRNAIAGSTSVKYIGNTSVADARWLAREMETTPEFIKAQRKVDRKYTQFACHVRSYIDRTISLTIPFGSLENQPQMTATQYVALIERNRLRVTYTEPVNVQPVTTPSTITTVPDVLAKLDTNQVAKNPDLSEPKPVPNTELDTGESGKTW